MRIRPDKGVGKRDPGPVPILVFPDRPRQVLQIDLVANSGSGRHDPKVLERRLPPFQEGIPFQVSFVFAFHIDPECTRIAEFVDHDRMVDDEVDRGQRIDLFRISPEFNNAVAHCREIDHGRNAGKILHEHARRPVGNLLGIPAAVPAPIGKSTDVVGIDACPVLEPEHVLEHDVKDGRKLGKFAQAGAFGRPDRVVIDVTVPGIQRSPGSETVASDRDNHLQLRRLTLNESHMHQR